MMLLDKLKDKSHIKWLLVFGCFLIVMGLVLIIPNAFAALTPVKSIIITSSKLDYSKKEAGSYNIVKSAEWIEKGKARITFDVDTIQKMKDKYTDIIFVLDISASMYGNKLTKVKQDSIELINNLLADSHNRAALITFESSSQLVLDLTNNKDELINTINNLEVTGCTNYYQALVNVDKILKNYKKEESRDCIVLFLTDGYPNEDIPNEEGEYSYLKKMYPYLTINGIQYEMGRDVLEPVKKVSDSQFIAYMTNLKNVLFEAAIAPIIYDEFLITDYINNDYFEIDGIDSIVASVGSTKLEYEDSIPKVIWDIRNLRSGLKAKLTIDINLKKEYLNKGGLYPTNKKEEIRSSILTIKEDITSTNTPVLADNYKVIYDGNAPGDCRVENVPATINKSVLETVEISNNVPVCGNYQFKGWYITTENIKKIDSNHFTMPESDVVIRANWSKMDITKSMDGKVFETLTLYKMIEGQAYLDNTKSEFVTANTGINFGEAASDTNGKGVYTIASTKDNEYPVHYFRGEVTNNNVKFANICWKIVRTTETGGVKLIYNGLPNNTGGCTNTTGTSTQIGKSTFSSNSNSPADVGYMYGTRYVYKGKSLGSSNWYSIVGKSRTYEADMGGTEYFYGDSVTYDEVTNSYTLNNIEKHLWWSDYRSLEGKYTCFKKTEEACETVSYLDSTSSSYTFYVDMISGETYESLIEQANNVKWIYGKDITYSNGVYKLVDPKEVSPMNWDEDSQAIVSTHRYTCYTNSDSCEDVGYTYFINVGLVYYMTLTGGKNIDDILKEMTTESSNTNNSLIKTAIDNWYQNNMVDYTSYLEDTVWCNDRSIYRKGGWDKNSTSSGSLDFGAYGRNFDTHEPNINAYKPSIECPNANDKFTVSDKLGNGKLTYPVALLTVDEAALAGHGSNTYSSRSYLYTNQWWWLLSSTYFNTSYAYGIYMNSFFASAIVDDSNVGVRPSVSLLPGVVVSEGNGTADFPFEVFLPGVD